MPIAYTKFGGDSVVIILFWVDDIIIAASNNQVLNNMKAYLSDKFKMKDMGKLSLFLGIEFTYPISTIPEHLHSTSQSHGKTT